MNPPRVYTCSPFWNPLPPPSPYHPSGSSQYTSPKHPVSCIEPGRAIHFTYDIIYVSVLFSQIIKPLPSPTEYIPYSCLAIFLKHAFFIPISNLCLYSFTSQNSQHQRWQMVSYRILKWLVKAAWVLQVEECGLFSFTDKDLNSVFLLWIPVYLVCIPQDNKSRKDFTSVWISIPRLCCKSGEGKVKNWVFWIYFVSQLQTIDNIVENTAFHFD